MDYRTIEAQWPDLAELPTYSAAWYRRYRERHLATYPDADPITRDNLAQFVKDAEAREARER